MKTSMKVIKRKTRIRTTLKRRNDDEEENREDEEIDDDMTITQDCLKSFEVGR